MRSIKHHRNITFRRLYLDACQFIRCQRPLVKLMGRQFERSQKYVEIDVTYRCNRGCLNCNRSCTQLPGRREISLDQIEAFIADSCKCDIKWERVRLLGGEPTLHSEILDIVDLLLRYRKIHHPKVRIVLCTNNFGRRVKRVLSMMPHEIEIKSALKSSNAPLFRPFNKAPVDTMYHKFSDFSCGCRILRDCGIGLTPGGYYACAVAGGIDRVFGFELGRQTLPGIEDSMVDQLEVFCKLCGHFGFAWPVKKAVVSATWQKAYRKKSPPAVPPSLSVTAHCVGNGLPAGR